MAEKKDEESTGNALKRRYCVCDKRGCRSFAFLFGLVWWQRSLAFGWRSEPDSHTQLPQPTPSVD